MVASSAGAGGHSVAALASGTQVAGGVMMGAAGTAAAWMELKGGHDSVEAPAVERQNQVEEVKSLLHEN